ncbi:hypothetical protein EPUS_08974 [Endocarpon pusillum Z07020]|uniref:ATPase AAA-type core domain-containing protein n=1 Tax=Endocarpon pusillum (strain Z07020 / HMAS-L-300199) TaxID=1263415 RepID=U1GD86_ENDPU|nr:uncharacterized protein EPUS_08974 [Endocarpon pusillum Z07020]ERF75562.1 hypothetical protein EPUS_08974 [Endocarpon pusillum Z07020]
MIDASFFREMNPNYARPKVDGSSSAIGCIDFFGGSSTSTDSTEKVRYADLEANELELTDLLVCCPTVPGFSFTDKLWLEFAVADIELISWSSDPFDCLEIPSQYKEIIMALVSNQINRDKDKVFDDFVAGKGRGMNVLLHGSPGVGKTLTTEAVSEHLELPFYSVSLLVPIPDSTHVV